MTYAAVELSKILDVELMASIVRIMPLKIFLSTHRVDDDLR